MISRRHWVGYLKADNLNLGYQH